MSEMEFANYSEILTIIENRIISSFSKSTSSFEDVYHHTCSFENAISIIKYGIMPIKDLCSLNIENYSSDSLKIKSDIDSHPNGVDGISLSKIGLTDLYKDELEYDPCNMYRVDFRISDIIKPSRNSTNYGNEFIYYSAINSELIKSCDIRLLKLIEKCKKSQNNEDIKYVVNCYNHLCDIAKQILAGNNNIEIREMSNEDAISLNANILSRQLKIG